MDDCAGLENRYTSGYRGFESHSLRQIVLSLDLGFSGLDSFLLLVVPFFALDSLS